MARRHVQRQRPDPHDQRQQQIQYNARVMWQPNGSVVLNQRAWSPARSTRRATSSRRRADLRRRDQLGKPEQLQRHAGNDQKWNAYSVDGIYKYRGFSVNGMYSLAQRDPETGAKLRCRRRLHPGRASCSVAGGTKWPGATASSIRRPHRSQHHPRGPRRLQLLLRASRTEVAERHRPGRDAAGPTGNVNKTWEFRSQLQFVF